MKRNKTSIVKEICFAFSHFAGDRERTLGTRRTVLGAVPELAAESCGEEQGRASCMRAG